MFNVGFDEGFQRFFLGGAHLLVSRICLWWVESHHQMVKSSVNSISVRVGKSDGRSDHHSNSILGQSQCPIYISTLDPSPFTLYPSLLASLIIDWWNLFHCCKWFSSSYAELDFWLANRSCISLGGLQMRILYKWCDPLDQWSRSWMHGPHWAP